MGQRKSVEELKAVADKIWQAKQLKTKYRSEYNWRLYFDGFLIAADFGLSERAGGSVAKLLKAKEKELDLELASLMKEDYALLLEGKISDEELELKEKAAKQALLDKSKKKDEEKEGTSEQKGV